MRFKLITIFSAMAIVSFFVGHAGAEVILAKDIYSGVNSSNPSGLTNVNGILFFAADNGINGVELWRASGTGGITPLFVKDINPAGSSSPRELTNVNGTLFFAANNGSNGVELWKSNGAASGTLLVRDINEFILASDSSNPNELTDVNGTLFFAADDWTNGEELWRSDGTEAGTVRVKDINTGNLGADSSKPGELTNVNGTLFFAADNGINGVELWSSDGTPGGTDIVKDINPGGSSSPSELTNVKGTLFFAANNGADGRELWKSDGTGAGTVHVKDIRPGANNSSDPNGLTNVNGTLFFAADDGTNGSELWKSDGTEAGTVEVKDIWAGIDSSAPTELTSGSLTFAADDGVNGRELWASDGTDAGTLIVKDIRTGANGSSPTELTNVGGVLFFSANDGSKGRELWRSSVPNGALFPGGSSGCFVDTAAFDIPTDIHAWILKAFWDK
jgi:ELWxxDGT repeat protein